MSTAFAGECPPDKVKANVRAPVDFKPIGVTDTVLATIDLSKEPIKASGHMQRVRLSSWRVDEEAFGDDAGAGTHRSGATSV
jgi:hypothetical protein